MPTQLSLKLTKAHNELRKFKNNKIKLKRDVFLVPGWTDQACLCWTEPYTESGIDRTPGWEYTVKDWGYIFENPEKMHYLQLVEDDNAIQIVKNKKGKTRKVKFESDPTCNYTNFFQFAELVKSKIRGIVNKTGIKEFDLIGHSMGGLDVIAAVTIDPGSDKDEDGLIKEFIKSKPLEGVGLLITVATPYKGSFPAHMVKHSKLDEIFRPKWTKGMREQCNNMAYDSPFVKIVNSDQIRERLLKAVTIGVHTFASDNDRAVAYKNAQIKGGNNHPPVTLAQHSQRMGITQNHTVQLELFTLLRG
jgi:hypothetical protein